MMDCVTYMKFLSRWTVGPKKSIKVRRKRIGKQFMFLEPGIVRDNRDVPKKKER